MAEAARQSFRVSEASNNPAFESVGSSQDHNWKDE
jgi:hypothetical protein